MANYLTTDTDLTTVADAIRTKGGTSEQLEFPQGFVDAIDAIEAGWSGLPAEYQEVEYIESTGTQYINTGIIPSSDDRFIIDWELINAISGNNSTIMGVSDGNASCQIRAYGLASFGSTWLQTENSPVPNGHLTFYRGVVEYSDGRRRTWSPGSYESPSNAIILCGLLTNGVLNENATIQMRVRKFEAMHSGVTLCKLVPCYRKSDQIPGMYDTVKRVFIANAGTGEFIVGADVASTSQALSILLGGSE